MWDMMVSKGYIINNIMDVNELINSIDCYIEMDVQNKEYLFGEYTYM